MKLITSEIDAEAEKWEEPDNEIVRRSKNMSSMAFSMYLFTRGEGPLKTTQDLFTQAEYFAEEGTKLFKTVKDFTQIVRIYVLIKALNLLLQVETSVLVLFSLFCLRKKKLTLLHFYHIYQNLSK